MDFVSPEPVIQALRERIDHGVFGYPSGIGDSPKDWTGMRQTIVDRMRDLFDWKISLGDIVFIPGVVTGFNLACHAFASPEEGVLIQTPVYPPILHAASSTGRKYQEMQLLRLPDGSYEVDWDSFEDNITPQTRVMILCNPHNPVGKVFTKEELERTAEICLRNNTIICSDEIHNDLIFNGYKHIPIAALDPEIAAATITLMSPSKTFNIAGLQCSFAIITNRVLRKRLLASKQGLVPWVNLMGMVAAEAALSDGEVWFQQLMEYLEGNKKYVHDFVNNELPGIDMAEPQGTYLAWLDCRSAGISENPFEFFLKKARVAFNEGGTFGNGGEGFVRLNFGCSRGLLEKALGRVKMALERLA
jgi:cystathionine beta-lyase